jgi:DNA recombination-dependent growth factor C
MYIGFIPPTEKIINLIVHVHDDELMTALWAEPQVLIAKVISLKIHQHKVLICNV